MKTSRPIVALALIAVLGTGVGCAKVRSKAAFKDGNKDYKEENFKKAVDALLADGPRPRMIGFSSFSEQSSFAGEMRLLFGEFMEKPSELDQFLDQVKKLCLEVNQPQMRA